LRKEDTESAKTRFILKAEQQEEIDRTGHKAGEQEQKEEKCKQQR
jgi:hypothetical protein